MDSLRLRRTNHFYPSNDGEPDLRGLLRQLGNERIALSDAIIDDILEIEDGLFDANRTGSADENLEALIVAAKRAAVLPPDKQRRAYFHLLRRGGLPKKLTAGDLILLYGAYADLVAQASRGYPAVILDRLHGLLHFGFTAGFDLDRTATPDLAEFTRRRAVWNLFRFHHLPGMLTKLEKFRPVGAEPETVTRLLELLRLIRFRTSDYSGTTYNVFNFPFWGMITIGLMAPASRDVLLDEFARERDSLPSFEQHVEVLRRIVDQIADDGIRAAVARAFGS